MSGATPDGTEPPSVPGAIAALLLTGIAWLSALMISAPFGGWASPTVALSVGIAIGFGGVGTLAARQVPPPAELRLGLRGFVPALLPALVLLIPAVVITSEIDNVVAALLARSADPLAEGDSAASATFAAVEALIAVVLLRPVVEEFFFRGVLQQGLVARHGAASGVAISSFLFALSRGAFVLPAGFAIVASVAAQALFLGALLGAVRQTTGSLLAPILVHAGMQALGFAALAFADRLPIPGLNAPGPHTPSALVASSALSVAIGFALLTRGR